MNRILDQLRIIEAYERGEDTGELAFLGAMWRGDWERELEIVLAEGERQR